MSEARTCENCTAWSQLVAWAEDSGVKALCLNPESERHMVGTLGRQSCARWTDNPAMADLT